MRLQLVFFYIMFVGIVNTATASLFCIYNGSGLSDALAYEKAYSQVLSDEYIFKCITASDIINGDVLANCALLVIPGWEDEPYCGALNGEGNCKIRKYIESGGRYFGTCAGAYYDADYYLYDENKQVCQRIEHPRELRFCPHVFCGPLSKSVPHDKPMMNKGCESDYTITDKCCRTHYFERSFFDYVNYHARERFTNILADYINDETARNDLFVNSEKILHWNASNIVSLPAIVFAKVKKGKVVLSGVRLENGNFDGENEDSDLAREELLRYIFRKLGLKTE